MNNRPDAHSPISPSRVDVEYAEKLAAAVPFIDGAVGAGVAETQACIRAMAAEITILRQRVEAAAYRPPEGQRDRIVGAMIEQIDKAYAKHGRRLWSRHEFYGVLREEVDELWDEIKRDTPMENVLKEALQVACVCVRYMETGDAYQGEHPQTLWTPTTAAVAREVP